jgi:hypothetical protein
MTDDALPSPEEAGIGGIDAHLSGGGGDDQRGA